MQPVNQRRDRYTIDELAGAAGMTVRNVRAHQTRGLLPAPELEGRTGYYGPGHLARLELIRDMQERGFNLSAIRQLIDAAPPGQEEELLAFEQVLTAPWQTEPPELHTAEELLQRFGDPSPDIVERAIALGLIEEAADGMFKVPMPTLLRAGEEIFALGVSREHLLEVLESLLENAQGIASSFTTVFLEGVWEPFEARGRPAQEWPQVREALERLRPIASEALMSAFGKKMQDTVDEAFGRLVSEDLADQEEAV